MKGRATRFVLAGYALAVTLVLVVALIAILRLDEAAEDRLQAMRHHEQRITLTERLRWRSELMVAAGRRYVIAGDQDSRQEFEESSAAFMTLWRDLRREEVDPRALGLLEQAMGAARAYDAAQGQLPAGGRAGAAGDLAARFERDLLPARRAFGQAIDAYVARQRALLEDAYAAVETQRLRSVELAVGGVGSAAVLAIALFWVTTRALARARAGERRALDQAEAALAARDEMLGVVAHDLRNPLSAISLKAGLLRETAPSEKTRRAAGSIENAAQRMGHLIQSLLDVTVIEAGGFTVRPAACELRELVDEARELLEAAAGARAIEIAAQAEEGVSVLADRERVIQVFSNLIGNAIKFTPEGGRVRILARRDGSEHALVEVIDTGPGLPPRDVERVFDRFWKRERAGVEGTGLGLFIARGIVEAHGGRIRVASVPGSGATFSFTLPLAGAVTDDPPRPVADREQRTLH